MSTTRILRLPAVLARVGLSRSSLNRLIKAQGFPAPRQLGTRSVGGCEADVEAWLASRVVAGAYRGAAAVDGRVGKLG